MVSEHELNWLQERSGVSSYDDNSLTLKYRLDNEFELVLVVAFQKILQLSYVDKFLDDIHLEFRDRYKNELSAGHLYDVRIRVNLRRTSKKNSFKDKPFFNELRTQVIPLIIISFVFSPRDLILSRGSDPCSAAAKSGVVLKLFFRSR